LASATEAILNGFFSYSFLIQLAIGVGLSFAWRMTAVAPTALVQTFGINATN